MYLWACSQLPSREYGNTFSVEPILPTGHRFARCGFSPARHHAKTVGSHDRLHVNADLSIEHRTEEGDHPSCECSYRATQQTTGALTPLRPPHYSGGGVRGGGERTDPIVSAGIGLLESTSRLSKCPRYRSAKVVLLVVTVGVKCAMVTTQQHFDPCQDERNQ